MAKTTIKVKGTVGFYGKVNELRGEGKVYRLLIENPVFDNATEEALQEMYSGDSWKDDTFYKDLISFFILPISLCILPTLVFKVLMSF